MSKKNPKEPKARLGKTYTVGNGNRFQRVEIKAKGGVFRQDVLIREGYHGPMLVTKADAKKAVLKLYRRMYQ